MFDLINPLGLVSSVSDSSFYGQMDRVQSLIEPHCDKTDFAFDISTSELLDKGPALRRDLIDAQRASVVDKKPFFLVKVIMCQKTKFPAVLYPSSTQEG